jgi:hypothetical protein
LLTQNNVLPFGVQKELQIIHKAWAEMAEQEQPLTKYVSKTLKKRNKKIASSAGEPYHTRSKGAPPPMSL